MTERLLVGAADAPPRAQGHHVQLAQQHDEKKREMILSSVASAGPAALMPVLLTGVRVLPSDLSAHLRRRCRHIDNTRRGRR